MKLFHQTITIRSVPFPDSSSFFNNSICLNHVGYIYCMPQNEHFGVFRFGTFSLFQSYYSLHCKKKNKKKIQVQKHHFAVVPKHGL